MNFQLYEWFEVEDNYVDMTRPVYSRLLPFRLRYILPVRMRTMAKERLAQSSLKGFREYAPVSDVTIAAIQRDMEEQKQHEAEAIRRVRSCYAALAKKLDQSNYFFGDR
jgi:glutathione S-transferase